MSHLLAKGIPPASLVIAGDSAGAHLALSLMSHILHPHPAVRRLILPSPIAGLVCICPMTTLTTSSASMQENKHRDIISPYIINEWHHAFTDTSSYHAELRAGGYWAETFPAPELWFQGIGSRACRRLLVTAGHEEVMRDDISVFVDKMQRVAAREGQWFEFESFLGKKECHNAHLLDFMFAGGRRGEELSESTKKVAAFVVETLGG